LARTSPLIEYLWLDTNVFLIGLSPIALYAGKSLRFIEAIVERGEDGNEELVNAYFLQCQFDEQGLWDANEKDRTMRGAVEAGSAVPKGTYMQELYTAKHIAHSDGIRLLSWWNG
jgi:hypothetical protein